MCVCVCVFPSDRDIARFLLGLHNLKIAQLYLFSEIILRWCAHLEMVTLSADRHIVLRNLKIVLIGKLRLTEILLQPFHSLWTTLTSFLNKYCICMGDSSRLVYLRRRKYFISPNQRLSCLNSGHYPKPNKYVIKVIFNADTTQTIQPPMRESVYHKQLSCCLRCLQMPFRRSPSFYFHMVS